MVKGHDSVLCKAGQKPDRLPHRTYHPTLAPLVPLSEMGHASTFHRALHLFNAEHLSSLTWDELTVPQQEEVRALMRELQRRRHVHS
jgi:hypothetical protein